MVLLLQSLFYVRFQISIFNLFVQFQNVVVFDLLLLQLIFIFCQLFNDLFHPLNFSLLFIGLNLKFLNNCTQFNNFLLLIMIAYLFRFFDNFKGFDFFRLFLKLLLLYFDDCRLVFKFQLILLFLFKEIEVQLFVIQAVFI